MELITVMGILERRFQLGVNRTTVGTEVVAGITTIHERVMQSRRC
jgi:xanthine/uracil/vitamin C permease (AzgA family)